MEQLAAAFGDFFSGGIASKVDEEGFPYKCEDFEIIVPRLVTPDRIIRIVKDREPKARPA